MSTTMEFKKFDPDVLRDKAWNASVIVGRRARGSTTLLKQLCAESKADVVLGFSAIGSAGDYGLPEAMLYNTLNWEAVECLMDIQSQCIKKGLRETSALVFFEEMEYTRDFYKNETFRRLMMNGRCLRISVIVTTQYLLDIPPPVRGNVDNWFLAGDNIVSNRQRLWKKAAGQFRTFKAFEAVFDGLTQDYGFLVSLQNVNSEKLVDTVRWFRADRAFVDRMPVRLCSPAFWKLTDELANKPAANGPRMDIAPPPGQLYEDLFPPPLSFPQPNPEAIFRIPPHASYPFYPPPPIGSNQATPAPPPPPAPIGQVKDPSSPCFNATTR